MTSVSSSSQIEISPLSFSISFSRQLICRWKIVIISSWRFWFKDKPCIATIGIRINRIITQISTLNKVLTLRSTTSMKKSRKRRSFVFCFTVSFHFNLSLIIIIGNGRFFRNFQINTICLICRTNIKSVSIGSVANLPTRIILRWHIQILIFRF